MSASRSGWAVDKPVRDDYLIFGNPLIEDDEIAEVVDTLRSGWLGTGPKVAAFEESFANYVDATHAMAVNSCTAALHLAMVVLGIGPGDEVIIPSMTFAATAGAVIHAGGRPIFADVDRETMCLTADDIAQRITSRTKAIVPVHFAGRPCDMKAILAIAAEHDLRVVEDCAHAIETRYHGRHVGTLGDVGTFSFYVTKNVVTGEGGMATTENAEWAARIKRLALHGLSADAWQRFSDAGFKHYEVTEPGFKYNMMDLQASLGLHQLERAEANLARRQQIWEIYDDAFADLPVFLPAPEESDTRHARHLYTLMLDIDRLRASRDRIQMALHAQNIGTGIHYRALHQHEFYRNSPEYENVPLPNSEWISDRTLSLPLSPKLTNTDVEDVILAVTNTLLYWSEGRGPAVNPRRC